MTALSMARLAAVLGAFALLLGVIVLVALATGPSEAGFSTVTGILIGGDESVDFDPALRDIVLRVRLPRVVLGLP